MKIEIKNNSYEKPYYPRIMKHKDLDDYYIIMGLDPENISQLFGYVLRISSHKSDEFMEKVWFNLTSLEDFDGEITLSND